jgi:hypothetical protein
MAFWPRDQSIFGIDRPQFKAACAINKGRDLRLDPANKYLVHAAVESSEMMNIHTGNVTTGSQGQATVQLPEWFEALNADFRYQLTVIGQFAQAIVAREMETTDSRSGRTRPW